MDPKVLGHGRRLGEGVGEPEDGRKLDTPMLINLDRGGSRMSHLKVLAFVARSIYVHISPLTVKARELIG